MNMQIQNATILVVEDESEILDLISGSLNRAGFECLKAKTAEEAIKLLLHFKVAIVLLDWNLKAYKQGDEAKSGSDVLRFCREQTPLTVVLVISTLLQEINVSVDSLFQGADGFVSKPLSMDMVVAHVSHWLTRLNTDNLFLPRSKKEVQTLDEVRRRYALRTVELFGDKGNAAKALGIDRHTLGSLVKNAESQPKPEESGEISIGGSLQRCNSGNSE